MKNLLFLFTFVLFLTSCQETDFKSTAVDNPKKATTINIQNTLDTAVIKIDTENHKLYLLKNNLVVREFKWYNNDQLPLPAGLIMFFFIFTLLGVGRFITWLVDLL